MYIKILTYIVLCSWFFTPSFAQNRQTTAWSFQHELPALTTFVHLSEPVEKIEKILAEENSDGDILKSWVYAIDINVDLNPRTSGQWDTIPGKGLVWRIGVHAENASSLNLLLENYQFQAGMSLYVYSEDRTSLVGPFDAQNNKNEGILPIQEIAGNTVIVEWNIPLSVSSLDYFTITAVGYGFRDIFGQDQITSMAALKCNIDINCKEGNHWQREKRAIVRISYRSGGAIHLCSGVLLNQATTTKKPYILTANHCISVDSEASSAIFYFEYEKTSCSAATSPSLPTGIVGSTLLTTKKELDFTLLKLSDGAITMAHHPYYAGWNASTDAPENGTGIHHPQGDVKKISITNEPLTSVTFTDSETKYTYATNAHWKVAQWDAGLTEQGSSGSPLFDQNHMVVGALTGGGTAKCGYAENDCYAKFCEMWNNSSNGILKSLLDPENKGITSLGGYDPIAPFEGTCDTMSHIGYNETELLIASNRWGYLTGHNNNRWTSFAEKFENDTVAQIIGIEAHIAKVFTKGSKVKFSIWKGDEYPSVLVYSKDTVVTSDYRQYPMHIYCKNTVKVTGNYFVGYSIQYNSTIDTFAVYQTKRSYQGVSALYIEDGGSWRSLSDETSSTYYSLAVKAIGRFGKGQSQSYQNPYHSVKVGFQYGQDNIAYAFIDKVVDDGKSIVLDCFDPTGKQMPVYELNREMMLIGDVMYLRVEIDISSLPYGMYIIRARNNKNFWSGKFVRL